MSAGTLYLVATPIGNLKDMTFRAVEILQWVDVIACEDTRRTGLLLSHYDIKKPLQSFHDHSSPAKIQFITGLLLSGKNIALVSDAGTPLISDPGFPLVREAIRQGIRVEGIPGPCALINALILSGFACEAFSFFGYLPMKPKKRKDLISSLAHEEKTLIFYESPYRLIKSLVDFDSVFPTRRIVVIREMTKTFEEIVRGTAKGAVSHFSGKKILGEFVIVLEGDVSH